MTYEEKLLKLDVGKAVLVHYHEYDTPEKYGHVLRFVTDLEAPLWVGIVIRLPSGNDIRVTLDCIEL